MYFRNTDDKIFEYLKTNKKTFIEDKIILRANRISYATNADITEEQFEIAEKFKELVSKVVFPEHCKIIC